MIQITAQGKFIDTREIMHLFTQGEKYSDVICFKLAKTNNDVDISNCQFVLRCVTVKGTMHESIIPSMIEGDNIILSWKPSNYVTSVSGMLRLELIASKGEERIVKFQMPAIYIKASITGKDMPAPDVIEEKLALMNELLAQAGEIEKQTISSIQSINDTKNVAVQAIYEALYSVVAMLSEVVTVPEQSDAPSS